MLHILRKGKLKKRVIAGFMALLMAASLLPTGLLGGAFVAKAGENVYTFESKDLEAKAQGDYKDGEAVQAGTDNFFTLYMSAKTKVDGSSKTWDDEYTSGQRLNFGGKADPVTPKNCIEFTTEGAATVTIWWVQGGDDNREMVIYKADGSTIAAQTTDGAYTKNSPYMSELKLEEAGKYYLGGLTNNNNIYKVEVVESVVEVTTNEYVFESLNLEAKAQGDYKDGDPVQAGTDNFFTLYMSAKTKVDGSSKTWDDGYTSGQRLNFGGKADPVTPKNCIEFTTEGTATVTIWWVQGGDDNREMVIYKADGSTIAAQTTDGAYTKNSPYMSELKLEEAGKYYLGGLTNNNNIYKVEVVETVVVPVINEYIFESLNLEAKAQGDYKDGEAVQAGTDNFFTLYMSAKTKVDGSSKTWDDEYTSGQRLNFGGKADPVTPKNCIEFTTEGTATVTIWWVQGGDDNREMVIYKADGSTIAAQTTDGAYTKNSPYMSELKLEEAGKYYLGGLTNNNNIYKVVVTDVVSGTVVETRKEWADVESPVLGTPVLKDGDVGTIVIPYTMVIGDDGADSVLITVKDSEGNELAQLKSLVEGPEGKKEYTPTASGTYTFSIVATREDEENKTGADVQFDFSLPLKAPVISSATSMGAGKVSVVWGAVPEAEKYEVYCDGELVTTTEELSYVVTGLTVGTKYAFTVVAVRGEDKSDASVAKETTATAEAKQVWGTTIYGPSTDTKKNGVEGDLNDDGKVTVYSEGGKGKIVPNSTDGVAFYYTAIPTDLNFTLRAKVTVDSWTLSNGQEGFGLMVTDRLGANGSGNVWNNQYMALASKIEYTSESGVKYSMKMGLGVIEKLGVTKDNLALFEKSDTATIQNEFKTSTQTLEYTAAEKNLEKATYNIVGNATKEAEGTIAEITEFILEIQRNNTGYFVTYYDAEGNVINQIKYYDTDALDQLDEEYVYAGFFAARNARATFSDVVLTTIDPKDDAPAEEKPVTKIEPSVTIQSADIANTENYTLAIIPNVDGTATVKLGDKVIAADLVLEGGVKFEKEITLPNADKNEIVVEFTPDPDQEMEEDTVLANTNKVTVSKTVNRCTRFEKLNNIYVSPNGLSTAKGTKNNPVDIYTAVKYVQPGQTIIIMEGTYLLSSTVRVERGINGTEDAMIKMIADPNAKTRPVFDFQGKCAGMVLGGDYWYFNGFDVTKSANAQKGIQVSGDNNVLDNINAYYNGNTGIQISRLFSADLFADWPANNLILNCTSYGNADAGYEDADGFAAKLTVGEGNVFDGCVAYNNADDGWDLYAKVETGAIGAVTIQNCVAFLNGYLEDGTNAGNGNGFKMGGESITGKHVLKNSYAFFNKAKGIDSNSCPDIRVYNSISYNNESYNVALYTNNAADTDFIAEGIISFKDATIKSGKDTGESFKPKGTQDTSKYLGDTNYYWDGTKSANASGTEVAADWFKSLTFTGITRNADGTINMNGFLELTDKAPENVGAVPAGQASEKVEVSSDAKEEVVKEIEVTDKTTVDELLNAVEAIIDAANKAEDNVVPVLNMAVKENTLVPVELLAGVKGEEVVIRVELENGIVWDIYGKDVTDSAVKVDLGVEINSDAIPEKDLAKVKELGATTSLSIAHDGEFGFDATIKYEFGKEADGKYATLFWYNDGAFEKAGSFVVEEGYAEFVLSHASDYVVVLSDAEISTDVIEKEEEPIAPKGDMAFPFYMILFLGIGLVAVGFYAKKKYTA